MEKDFDSWNKIKNALKDIKKKLKNLFP